MSSTIQHILTRRGALRLAALAIAWGGLLSAAAADDALSTLTVRIDQISGRSGTLHVELFTADTYDAGTAVLSRSVKVNGTSANVTFVGVPAGTYGVHVVQDLNQSGKQERTLIGASSEPQGYSNYTGRVKKPSFRDIRFATSTGDNKVIVHLHN
ncbi:MAG: DUF2141 domain-containing protein [Rhizomicrobium sp.]